MRSARRTVAFALAVVTSIAARTTLAQDPSSLPGSSTSGAATGSFGTAASRPYWDAGKPRAFVSSILELGIFYYRPSLAVGYGEPHRTWIGAETQARMTAGSGSEYVGVHAALPEIDLRLGARYQLASNQSYLERGDSYDDEETEFDGPPNARYVTLEGELAGALPIGDGALFGLFSAYYVLGVPERYDLLEDQMNVAIRPPWLLRGRGGYLHAFGVDGGLRVGAAAEVIHNPERDLYVFRAGPQLGVTLTHHLEAGVSIMIAILSKDDLDLSGTEISQFGFRYRWATGDPFPEFP
jgi:hypothetical protein